MSRFNIHGFCKQILPLLIVGMDYDLDTASNESLLRMYTIYCELLLPAIKVLGETKSSELLGTNYKHGVQLLMQHGVERTPDEMKQVYKNVDIILKLELGSTP